MQQWFLGVQALAPLSVHHLTMGGVLWQRLIMKLNFYGLVTNHLTLTAASRSPTRPPWDGLLTGCARVAYCDLVLFQEPIKNERISSWTSNDDSHWGY